MLDGSCPLQDLTSIMDETLKILEDDIEGLYENWFIETCNEWVAPYIGDLVGANLLRSVKAGGAVSGKTFVANTIHYRKRKGTVAIFEEMARNITGWDARVVEFFQFMSTTQNVNHRRLENKCTLNIVDPEPLELVGTAFDPVPHTLDVRSIKNDLGYYNVRNLGVFLWRLTVYPVRGARAFCHDSASEVGKRYSFNSIGLDVALFNHPADLHGEILSKEVNVSTPIRRLIAKKYLGRYYGENKSILLEVEKAGGSGKEVVAEQQIVICDLSDDDLGNWNVPIDFASSDKVAIDPVLGRILFSDSFADQVLDRGVFVTYYYGFSADMGGGFYRRDLYENGVDDNWATYSISINNTDDADYPSVNAALRSWMDSDDKKSVVFEIIDSEIYKLTPDEIGKIVIPEGVTLVLRSAQEQRATLTADNNAARVFSISGKSGSCLVFDGLLIDRNIRFEVVNQASGDPSSLKQFVIQHCSLVPSLVLSNHPLDAGDGCSVFVEGNDLLTVTLDKSICGKIDMKKSKGQLVVKDSIIDKSSSTGEVAVCCFEALLENSTVLGQSVFDILTYASNVLFADTVKVTRRQEGCVRFSYISNRFNNDATASRMPRCYRCQPEDETFSFVPLFVSEKYGSSGYAQLYKRNVKVLFEGADNGSEIGAFNQVYQSHRVNNLLATFAEYLPFGLEAGIIIVT
jgi:hypothetical protein